MNYLLLSLLFCHFLGDFTHLSTNWMLKAKKLGEPLFPIFCHASVHAILMIIVLFLFNISLTKIILLFFIELISHFIIDVLKGKLNVWSPNLANPINKFHWYIFGFDQFLHIVTILFIVSLI